MVDIAEKRKQMEDFWERYEKHIKKCDVSSYLIMDGVSLEKMDVYFDQHRIPKILFVFKESNESDAKDRKCKSIYQKDGWFGSYKNSRRDKRGITKMIKWYQCVLDIAERCRNQKELDEIDIKKYQVDPETIYKFSFINMSKRGHGKKKSEDKRIIEIIEQDKELLREEIKILDPDVIVIGGKNVSRQFEDKVISGMNKKTIHIAHFSAPVGYNDKKYNASEETFIEQCRKAFTDIKMEV